MNNYNLVCRYYFKLISKSYSWIFNSRCSILFLDVLYYFQLDFYINLDFGIEYSILALGAIVLAEHRIQRRPIQRPYNLAKYYF